MTQPDAVSQGEMESGVTEAGAWEVVTRMAGGANVGPRFLSLARLVVELDKRLTEVSGKLLVLTRMGESTNEDVGSLNNDAESFEQRIAYLESTLSAITQGMEDAERTPEEWRATATNELLHHSEPWYWDGAPAGVVLRAILRCAEAWSPEARLLGNVRADDIAMAVRGALLASQEDGKRMEGWARVTGDGNWVCFANWPDDDPENGNRVRATLLIHPATESREAPGPSCDVVCQSCGARYCTKTHPYCPLCAASRPTPAQSDAPPDDAALGWIGCVCYELTEAGFPAGDRTVALASIRRLIAEHRPAPVESGDERKAGGGRALRALLQGELTRWMYSVSKIQSPVDVAKRADIIATTIEALQLARSPLPHENEPVAYISRDTLQRLKSGWSSGSQLYGRKEIAVPLEQVIPLFTASPSLPDQKARVGTPLEQALHFRENLAIGLEQAAVMIRTDGENFHQKARVGTLSWEEARELIEAAFARCYRAQHGGNFQEPWNGHGNEAKRLLSALGFTDRSEP